MGAAARTRVQREFTTQLMIDGIRGVYAELLEGRQRERSSAEAEDLDERQNSDPEIESQGPVLDVEVVPLDTIGNRGLATQAMDLCPAGDAGLDAVAGVVAGHLTIEAGDEVRTLGRGPTMLMSPQRTLISCGSSSSELRRSICPSRVRRSYPSTPPGARPRGGSNRLSAAMSTIVRN